MKYSEIVFTIVITSLSFLSFEVNAQSAKNSCVEVLNDSSSKNLPQVTSPRRQLIRRTKASNALAVTGSATIRLTNAEIIHSAFFQDILRQSTDKAKAAGVEVSYLTAEQIKALSDEEVDQISMVLLDEIKDQIQTNGVSLSLITDVKLASDALLGLSDEEVIDVIGETLKIIGVEGFLDKKTMIERAIARARKIGSVEGGLSFLTLAGAGIAAAVTYESGLYYSYSLWSAGGLEAGSFFGALAAGTTGAVDSVRRFLVGSSNAEISVIENLVEMHNGVDLIHSHDSSMFYIPQGIAGRLKGYESKVDAILADYNNRQVEGQEPRGRSEATVENFLHYADDIVELRTEISTVFFDDFIKWVDIYDRNKDLVKKRIRQIQAGELEGRESHRRIVRFLDKSLTEALEAIILTRKLTAGLLEVLGTELQVLRDLDSSSFEETEVVTYNSRVDSVSVTMVSLGLFFAQLKNTHKYINDLNSEVEALGNIETLAITNQLGAGGSLQNDASQAFSISDLLTAMETFENSVSALRTGN